MLYAYLAISGLIHHFVSRNIDPIRKCNVNIVEPYELWPERPATWLFGLSADRRLTIAVHTCHGDAAT